MSQVTGSPQTWWSASRSVVGAVVLAAVLLALGCTSTPEYDRQLAPGKSALRKISDPDQLPDLTVAVSHRDSDLRDALDRSIHWFDIASTQKFYPLMPLGITHEQAQLSVRAMRQILVESTTPADFQRRVREEFDTYMSVGWNDEGVVLFTGYYTPIFPASRVKTDEYRYPLYMKPPDLDTTTTPDKPMRILAGNERGPYPGRAVIEQYHETLGLKELVWLRDKFEVYIVQIQGSAQLKLTDGTTMNVGYSGSNGIDYTFSVNRALVKENKLDRAHANLPGIIAYFKAHPDEVDTYLNQNERYVFFQEYNNPEWPAGSLGFKVTPQRSLAVDKSIFPRGCATLVVTEAPVPSGTGEGAKGDNQFFRQLMVDQDTGNAIRAPGRGDIYYGIGDAAGDLAGRQYAEGKLYYFFLKPEKLEFWRKGLTPTPVPVTLK